MRLLHTADWHLGRLFHQVHLTDDQAYVLEQFVALVQDARPDLVVIAGDIYDRAVPPPDAVTLLDETLSRLILDCNVRVALIAGNHDSAQRLHFGSRLLAERGLHIAGAFTGTPLQLSLDDSAGPVHLYALPYAEPSVVREKLGVDVHDHDAAMRAQLDVIRQSHPAGARAIVVAHAFLAGAQGSEHSERPLSVGTTGAVGVDAFEGFSYVALGHLHRPQSLDGGRLHYAGSLLKYSFDEADHRKGVSLVEIDATGACNIEQIPLTPRRDVRRISGLLADLLATPDPDISRDDYLEVTLLDDGVVFDTMGRLREVYPNVLHIERTAFAAPEALDVSRADHRRRDTADLFGDFFTQVTGQDFSEELRGLFVEETDTLHQCQREAATP